MSVVQQAYYEKLIDLMSSTTGKIKVCDTFHGQMKQIKSVLGNDKTGLVSSLLEFMIHAGTVDINFNAKNSNLTKLFEICNNKINYF